MGLVLKSAIFIAAMSYCLFSQAQLPQFRQYQSIRDYKNGYVMREYPRINFRVDFDSAFMEAVRSNKPVLVYYTGGYSCGPCITLKNTKLKDPNFYKFINQHFVPILMNVSNHEAEFNTQPQGLRKRTRELTPGGMGLPSFIVFKTRGFKAGQNLAIHKHWSPAATGADLGKFLSEIAIEWKNWRGN